MLAFVYNEGQESRSLVLKEVEKPKAQAGSAVIQVNASSICGTDLRTYRFGSEKIKSPMIIGHEAVGTIVEAGSDIRKFKIGDRVQIAPAIGCGICPSCKKGYTNLCDNLKTIGFDFNGTFAEYMEIPAEAFARDHVTLVPEHLNSSEAVLAEPIACVFNAQEYLNISKGDTIAIFGSGFIGTMHAELAYHKGAKTVFMIDINDHRLAMTKKILPDLITINSLEQPLPKTVLDCTDNQGVDVAVTACSAGTAQRDALNIIAKRGRISLFGGLPQETTGFLDSNIIHYKEVSVYGAHASTVLQNRKVLDMIASGKLAVSHFVEQTFTLSSIEEAFKAVNSERIFKAVIIG